MRRKMRELTEHIGGDYPSPPNRKLCFGRHSAGGFVRFVRTGGVNWGFIRYKVEGQPDGLGRTSKLKTKRQKLKRSEQNPRNEEARQGSRRFNCLLQPVSTLAGIPSPLNEAPKHLRYILLVFIIGVVVYWSALLSDANEVSISKRSLDLLVVLYHT